MRFSVDIQYMVYHEDVLLFIFVNIIYLQYCQRFVLYSV